MRVMHVVILKDAMEDRERGLGVVANDGWRCKPDVTSECQSESTKMLVPGESAADYYRVKHEHEYCQGDGWALTYARHSRHANA